MPQQGKPHSRQITVFDFDGLSEKAQAKVLEEVRSGRADFERRHISEWLTREVLPVLLKEHGMEGFCVMHSELTPNVYVSFWHGEKGGASVDGRIHWTRGDERYTISVVYSVHMDLLGFDTSEYQKVSRSKLVKIWKRDKSAADASVVEEFRKKFEEICEKLAEKGNERYQKHMSREAIIALLRENRTTYLSDGTTLLRSISASGPLIDDATVS